MDLVGDLAGAVMADEVLLQELSKLDRWFVPLPAAELGYPTHLQVARGADTGSR